MDRIGMIELLGDHNVVDMPAKATVLYAVQEGSSVKVFVQGTGEDMLIERTLNFLRAKEDVPPNHKFILAVPYMTVTGGSQKLDVLFLYEDTTGQSQLKVIPLQETDDGEDSQTTQRQTGNEGGSNKSPIAKIGKEK